MGQRMPSPYGPMQIPEASAYQKAYGQMFFAGGSPIQGVTKRRLGLKDVLEAPPMIENDFWKQNEKDAYDRGNK